jgi:hypothetical protein
MPVGADTWICLYKMYYSMNMIGQYNIFIQSDMLKININYLSERKTTIYKFD